MSIQKGMFKETINMLNSISHLKNEISIYVQMYMILVEVFQPLTA